MSTLFLIISSRVNVNVFHTTLIPDFQRNVVLRPEVELGYVVETLQTVTRGYTEVKSRSATGDQIGDFIE